MRAGEGQGASPTGWDARLYLLWILYNSIAFVTVLTAGFVLTWFGADVLHLTSSNHHTLVALLVATLGALLFGVVLGVLQWLVIRRRADVLRRRWVIANIGPALLGWVLVIMPAVISAENSHQTVSTAYLLAASQTLALGPLLAVSQAAVLRRYTTRWPWWIGVNLASWLVVDLFAYLLSHHFTSLNYARGDGSIAEVYLMLIVTTPLTGRGLLWVLAPSAVTAPNRRPAAR